MTGVPALDGLVPDRLRPRSARIILDALEVSADIGFHDYEIGSPQRLLVTVEVWLDSVPLIGSDEPRAAWDYDVVRKLVEELATTRRYNLQETLAHAIYQHVAALHGVSALRVATSKPDTYPNALGVGVELRSFNGPEPPAEGAGAHAGQGRGLSWNKIDCAALVAKLRRPSCCR